MNGLVHEFTHVLFDGGRRGQCLELGLGRYEQGSPHGEQEGIVLRSCVGLRVLSHRVFVCLFCLFCGIEECDSFFTTTRKLRRSSSVSCCFN